MNNVTGCTNIKSGLGLINSTNLPHTCASQQSLDKKLTLLIVTLGAFAVLMIVIGGFRYITAGGNAESAAKARNMIVYSLVGLVLAAMAGLIVNAILGWLK